MLLASLAPAQEQNPALKPPKGAQVAIVVFEDLQCPDCRRAAPLVEQAAKTYKIPVVRYDFPLPMHNWSFEAAVIARYFDEQSRQMGIDFRDTFLSTNPRSRPPTLRSFAERFAAAHKVDLPFVVDPRASSPPRSTRTEAGQRVESTHPNHLRGQQQDPGQTFCRGGGPQPAVPIDRRHEAGIRSNIRGPRIHPDRRGSNPLEI